MRNISSLLSPVATLPFMAKETLETRDRTAFGQRLRAARTHAKLTQTELGEKTGIGQSGIAYLESKGHASEQTWLLAQVCGVRAAWLARDDGPMLGHETELDAARDVASEALPKYLSAPNNAKDYRTIAHTLAASLEESGLTLTVKQFLALVDDVFRRLGDQ
jgi:transcriptional regulator with XRE-family HTH domain